MVIVDIVERVEIRDEEEVEEVKDVADAGVLGRGGVGGVGSTGVHGRWNCPGGRCWNGLGKCSGVEICWVMNWEMRSRRGVE